MDNLSVIQFNESFYPVMDGVASVTKNYAYWIKKKYGKAYVVTPEFPGHVDDEIFPVLRYPSIPLVLRKPYRMGVSPHNPKLWKKLYSLNVDLAHAQSPFSAGNIALQYARNKNVPLVATFHSKFYDDFKELTRSDVISWIMTHLVVDFFNYADAVWAVNESTKETLLSYGYKGSVDVVPNGADFSIPENLNELLAHSEVKYDLRPDDLVFLFVGQMIRQKNIAMIIHALKALKEAKLDFKMILVGEGKSKDEFMDLVASFHMEDRVRFTGMVLDRNELKGLYARADLFIFPSVYDNAPVVTREAAALGTPSVIVRGSNAAEGIIDGKNGFLCENTSEDLASVMLHVAKDRDLLRQAGDMAQKTIFRSWEDIVDTFVVPKYLDIIRNFRGK